MTFFYTYLISFVTQLIILFIINQFHQYLDTALSHHHLSTQWVVLDHVT